MRTLVSCFVLLVPLVASAETWHVSPSGNDAAAGTSAAPWRTLQRAATAVTAGDTVNIQPGTYAGFRVTAQGTQAAPIAFVGQGDVRIDGAATANRDAVLVEGGAWIRIEGLTVTGAARAGIAALDCHHVTVRGNKVDANRKWGVFSAFCDDLVVEDNEASRSVEQHGVYASNSADRPIIRGNRIWGNAMCGVHMNGDVTFGGDGVISDAVVENNMIVGNGALGGSAINGDGVTNAVIRNNVLDGNHASGVSLYRIDGGAASTGNQVVNNTIRMAADARWAVNLQDAATDNTVRNNVILSRSASRGAIDLCAGCGAGLVSDHNAVVGRFSVGGQVVDLAGWRARTGTDAASFAAGEAELFVDAAGGDLALRAGSPAIDRGTSIGAPATAIDGTVRPQGAAVDIGAYEACTGPCTGGEPPGGDGDEPGEPPGGEDDPPGGGAGGEDPADDEGAGTKSSGCSATGGAGLAWLLLGLPLAARRRRRRRAGGAIRGRHVAAASVRRPRGLW